MGCSLPLFSRWLKKVVHKYLMQIKHIIIFIYFLSFPSFCPCSLRQCEFNFGSDLPVTLNISYLYLTYAPVPWTPCEDVCVQHVWLMSNVTRSEMKGGWEEGGPVISRVTWWGNPDSQRSLYFSIIHLPLLLNNGWFSHERCHMYSTCHTDDMALRDHQLSFGLQQVTVRAIAHRGDKAVASGGPITQSLTHTHSHWGNNVCKSLTVTSTQQPLSVRTELRIRAQIQIQWTSLGDRRHTHTHTPTYAHSWHTLRRQMNY